MSIKSNFETLRQLEQKAYVCKQAMHEKWLNIKNRTDSAFQIKQVCQRELNEAREKMNYEYEYMQSSRNEYQREWDSYKNICSYNTSRINSLKNETDSEHHSMQYCYSQASSEYHYGDKSRASSYAKEAKMHKNKRDQLNSEIKYLIQEIQNSKPNKIRKHTVENTNFQVAKNIFARKKNELE